MEDTSTRVAIIGDVGGHVDELRAELRRLGADPQTGRLPDDLTVIQVGDLVHRGPDSEAVVALVDGYLGSQPEQWVQLVGNHEAQYLREPAFEWPERIHDRAELTLQTWWSTGKMRAAAAVTTADGQALVTHAGLTEGFWRRVLDGPADANQAAAALNSFIGSHERVLFAAGQMLGGGDPNLSAGPVWASAASEVVPSWFGSDVDALPFDLVHGHSGVVDWDAGRARSAEQFTSALQVDDAAKHATVTVPGGARVVGIDPGHGRRPRTPWRALVVTGASVTA